MSMAILTDTLTSIPVSAEPSDIVLPSIRVPVIQAFVINLTLISCSMTPWEPLFEPHFSGLQKWLPW